jgi:hypothetical protein
MMVTPEMQRAIYKIIHVYQYFYPLANEVAKGYSNATVRPSHPCEHSKINILQWILTKLGTISKIVEM